MNHHRVHDVRPALSPADDVGNLIQGVGGDRLVERAGQATLARQHLRELLAQGVEVGLGLRALGVFPLLRGVDVEGEPEGAGALQIAEQLGGEGQAVGVDDRLPTHVADHRHDVEDLRVHQWVTTGDAHAVGVSVPLEGREIVRDLGQALVPIARARIPVATGTIQVARCRHLDPGDGVVGERPGQAVVALRINGGNHAETLSVDGTLRRGDRSARGSTGRAK